MDFAAALALATKAVEVFMEVEPIAVQAVKDFKPFIINFVEKLTGQPVTPDQRTEAEAKIDDLHARFQAPIPPDDQQ